MSPGVAGGSTGTRAAGAAGPQNARPIGVRIAGAGSCIPRLKITNADLERLMDTTDDWITQRTGIKSRHVSRAEYGETTAHFAIESSRIAIREAGIEAKDIDLILVATMTPDCPAPAVGCVVANALGTPNAGAMDINAACSGFVYSMNLGHDLIRGGGYRNVLVIGADRITQHLQFSTYGRSTSVLFGDGAGAVLLCATDDATKGLIAQAMHSDGGGSKYLYIPRTKADFPTPEEFDERKLGHVQMNGAAVFKFAVGTFSKLIEQTLEKAGIEASEVDHYVCHQSNARILEAARERFGLAPEKLHVNIDRFGNTVAASVPLAFDEIRRAGRVKEGQKVMFLAFGAGLTWGSSLWQL